MAKKILFILLFASFFRFYNLQKWFLFGMDQEYEALIVKNILSFKHFPLIGVNASNTGIYLGPFFIYFAALPFAIFKGNPIGWAITASIFGILTCYLVYKIGQEMFTRRVGFYASFLYSFSFLMSLYDRQFWNPSLVPLFSLLIGFFAYKILLKKTKYLYLLALIFGIAVQSHLSILSFIPIILYVLWKSKKYISKKTFLFSIGLFLLFQSPVILFELRHNFLNTKAFYSLVSGKNKITHPDSNFGNRYSLFLSTLGRFYWIPPGPDLFIENGQCKDNKSFRKESYPESIALVLFGIITFIWYWMKSRAKEKSYYSSRIILGVCFSALAVVLFYNRIIYEYYFLFFFPWLAIILGWCLDHFTNLKFGKIIISIIIFIFIFVNLLTIFTATMSYSYTDKVKGITFVKEYLGNKNYTLEALGDCPRFGGYRYLYSYLIKPPIHSYMDSYYNWLYPQDSKDNLLSTTVLLSLIDPRDDLAKMTRWYETKLQFLNRSKVITQDRKGDISVYLLE